VSIETILAEERKIGLRPAQAAHVIFPLLFLALYL
jgi:hypothetical protein